jgi:hypothetical protein
MKYNNIIGKLYNALPGMSPDVLISQTLGIGS